MSKKLIIIKIAFNTMLFHDNRFCPDWIDYRIKIFMNYTYKSLLNQTNQNFLCFVHYEPSTEESIKSSLSKYDKLKENIIFIPDSTLYINKMLPNYDYVYDIRLDADDMYHPTYIEQLFSIDISEDTQVIINQNGYVYDIENNRLGVWYATSPPFYALIYKSSDYLSGFRYTLQGGHPGAIKLNHIIVDNSNYVVIIHGKNTSTRFICRFNKREILDDVEKTKILNEFKLI